MNKYIFGLVFVLVFAVVPCVCLGGGGSGYQEQDREGWLQSSSPVEGSVVFDGTLVNGFAGDLLVGTGFAAVGEDRPVEKLPVSSVGLSWFTLLMIFIFVAVLVAGFVSFNRVGDFVRKKLPKSNL